MTHYSPREQEILHLVADLRTRDELKAIVGCKPSTLDHHLCRIYDRADVHSYIELVRYALENGYGCRYQALLTECTVEAALKRKAEKVGKPRMIVERAYKMKNKLIIEGRLT